MERYMVRDISPEKMGSFIMGSGLKIRFTEGGLLCRSTGTCMRESGRTAVEMELATIIGTMAIDISAIGRTI